ncbi:MAG: pilus assembly protein [Candidatus Marinimicrobia bacterium]|nr:pilus assembly protein [Candidatus Neomarinimicrobiota bacterium]
MRNISSRRRAGQALIESCLVVALISLILFGLFQVAQLYSARQILQHAALAGARARVVGFNAFVVHKAVRVATIPHAGRMLEPVLERQADGGRWRAWTPGQAWDLALRARPATPQTALEQARIPLYLGAAHWGDLPGILDYADWDTVRIARWVEGEAAVEITVRQDLPLRLPFRAAFYAHEQAPLEGAARLENHFPLYLQ